MDRRDSSLRDFLRGDHGIVYIFERAGFRTIWAIRSAATSKSNSVRSISSYARQARTFAIRCFILNMRSFSVIFSMIIIISATSFLDKNSFDVVLFL